MEELKELQADVRKAVSRLHRDQTPLFRKAAKASFRRGIYRGIEEGVLTRMPFYRDLAPAGGDLATDLLRSLEKAVILIVSADPKRGNRVRLEQSERSISHSMRTE